MKTVDFVRFVSALCLTILPATGAGAQATSDPAFLISAFNETCRRGFPDLETIRQRAQSLGWVQRGARLIGESSDRRLRDAPIPDFLQKGDMMMVLSSPNKLWSKSGCSVSVSGRETFDAGALAAAVSAALGGAEPEHAKERGVERATWRVKSGIVVNVSVGKSGRTRTATVAVLTN